MQNLSLEQKLKILQDCRKSPGEGGFSSEDVHQLAAYIGIVNHGLYGKKEDLCQVVETYMKSSIPPEYLHQMQPGRNITNAKIAEILYDYGQKIGRAHV